MDNKVNIYEAITHSIRVTVEPVFLDDQSLPEKNQYIWAYIVNIFNEGDKTVRLKRRSWVITDENGCQKYITGEGVVGEQPNLEPGEHFEYSSGAPLSTPSGFMGGTYQMQSETGECFEIDIPTFSLDSPFTRRALN